MTIKRCIRGCGRVYNIVVNGFTYDVVNVCLQEEKHDIPNLGKVKG
mgnify:CR=1 FL=1